MRVGRGVVAAAGILALVVAAAAGWVVGGDGGAGPAVVVGGNTPIDPRRAADTLDTTAANSPTVVENPRHPANLVLVSRIDTPRFSCTMDVSLDGGATWAQTPIPPPPGAPAVACFGPDATFSADGSLHVSFTSAGAVPGQGTAPDAVWVATSHDGGRTLGAPVRAGGPLAFQVRIAADPSQPGRVYLCWLQAGDTAPWGLVGAANPIVSTRSDDGGATWAPPARVSPPSRSLVVAPVPAVTVDGGLVVAYLDVGDDRLDYDGAHAGKGGDPYAGPWWLVAARSDDGGATWQEGVVDRLAPATRFIQLFPPAPSVAVAGRQVYVAFADARRGDADAWVWASADGGRRWSPARRVNDARPGDQYLPAVSVAPGGRVDVVYYDRRADPGGTMNEVSLQSSRDHGRTFGPRTLLSDRAFDAAIGFGADRGLPELGSRLAVLAGRTGVLAVWADTRSGTRASAHQDLARAVARVAADPGSARRARDASLAVAVTAAVLGPFGLVALRRRRTPSRRISEPDPMPAPN
ncbi:MAG TPA: sialidase family protein [Acidimicrobiales bacterium]|nr:sialidase family protein [Acidimicrobiales bacterium]